MALSLAIPSLLISYGATVRHTSALHDTAYRRNDATSISMMEWLLKARIDDNELEYEGWEHKVPRVAWCWDWGTVLHTTVKEGSVPRARSLMEHRVNLGKKSRWDYTARDRAQVSKKEDVQRYLEAVIGKRDGVHGLED